MVVFVILGLLSRVRVREGFMVWARGRVTIVWRYTVLWLHVASNYDICRYTEVIAPCSFSINFSAEYPFKKI